MSDFNVEVVMIDDVEPHPNADRLDLAKVRGWQVVVGRGQFKKHDLAVFFPIDSVLPAELENLLFHDSKIKPKNGRIRTCKIRGLISQGLLASLDGVGLAPREISGMPGAVLTDALGVVKYEPPAPAWSGTFGDQRKKRDLNPHFHEYRDIPRLKNLPYAFKEGDMVTVTEKIHGTNFRAGWVKYVPRTLWQRVKSWFGYAPEYEFVYGSRRVQLQDKSSWDGFYSGNVYDEAVRKYDLRNKLPNGMVVYGEIYGDGIQKGYSYGCGADEHKLVLFDMHMDGREASQPLFRHLAGCYGLPTVPVLFEGPYVPRSVMQLASGPSVLAPSQAVREGAVCRATEGEAAQVVKIINEEYELLQATKEGTDYH